MQATDRPHRSRGCPLARFPSRRSRFARSPAPRTRALQILRRDRKTSAWCGETRCRPPRQQSLLSLDRFYGGRPAHRRAQRCPSPTAWAAVTQPGAGLYDGVARSTRLAIFGPARACPARRAASRAAGSRSTTRTTERSSPPRAASRRHRPSAAALLAPVRRRPTSSVDRAPSRSAAAGCASPCRSSRHRPTLRRGEARARRSHRGGPRRARRRRRRRRRARGGAGLVGGSAEPQRRHQRSAAAAVVAGARRVRGVSANVRRPKSARALEGDAGGRLRDDRVGARESHRV